MTFVAIGALRVNTHNFEVSSFLAHVDLLSTECRS